jgi:hypothetical protein
MFCPLKPTCMEVLTFGLLLADVLCSNICLPHVFGRPCSHTLQGTEHTTMLLGSPCAALVGANKHTWGSQGA